MHFLVEHGYVLLAIWVMLDQTGVPAPAVPGLIMAGALAGTGQLELVTVLGVATLASLPSDLLWYEVGRRRGGSVLGFLCRLSLEPESCVRTTENVFARYGARTLLVGNFVPGLQTAAPPLAGMMRMPLARFLLLDSAGNHLVRRRVDGDLAGGKQKAARLDGLRIGPDRRRRAVGSDDLFTHWPLPGFSGPIRPPRGR